MSGKTVGDAVSPLKVDTGSLSVTTGHRRLSLIQLVLGGAETRVPVAAPSHRVRKNVRGRQPAWPASLHGLFFVTRTKRSEILSGGVLGAPRVMGVVWTWSNLLAEHETTG